MQPHIALHNRHTRSLRPPITANRVRAEAKWFRAAAFGFRAEVFGCRFIAIRVRATTKRFRAAAFGCRATTKRFRAGAIGFRAEAIGFHFVATQATTTCQEAWLCKRASVRITQVALARTTLQSQRCRGTKDVMPAATVTSDRDDCLIKRLARKQLPTAFRTPASGDTTNVVSARNARTVRRASATNPSLSHPNSQGKERCHVKRQRPVENDACDLEGQQQ